MNDKAIYLVLDVTQKDIDRGIPGDEQKCALGLAFERLQKEFINKAQAEFPENFNWVGKLPPEANEFMDKFDRRCHVEPTKFPVELRPGHCATGTRKTAKYPFVHVKINVPED